MRTLVQLTFLDLAPQPESLTITTEVCCIHTSLSSSTYRLPSLVFQLLMICALIQTKLSFSCADDFFRTFGRLGWPHFVTDADVSADILKCLFKLEFVTSVDSFLGAFKHRTLVSTCMAQQHNNEFSLYQM
jgi:hypothetical protein